jgi:hypothetical protein
LDSNRNTLGGAPATSENLSLYARDPVAGRWEVVLDWFSPVTGHELVEPFTGTISLKAITAAGNLPDDPGATLTAGVAHTFTVTLKNTSQQTLQFFADPRVAGTTENLRLTDFRGVEGNMALPTNGIIPVYLVPPHTTQLDASQTSSVPSTFDLTYEGGDPDIVPAADSIAVPGAGGIDTTSLSFTEPQVAPGVWLLFPDLIGPFGANPPAQTTASAQVTAVTQAFDPDVTSSTGDFWTTASATLAPAAPGQRATIAITITPSGAPGTVHSGTVDLDDLTQSNLADAHGDIVGSIPYEYTVG